MNIYKVLIKRELWENKVSFIYAPVVVSLLILALVASAALYTKGAINGNGVHFNTTSNGVPIEAGVSVDGGAGLRPITGQKATSDQIDMKAAVLANPAYFSGIVTGVMYANCVMLYLVFSIVLGAYALRCLFDDRKNKDILFWRSMPVSESANVLTKLVMIFLVGPSVILVLNTLVALVVFLAAIVYFTLHGVGFGYLIASVISGGAYYIPLQIFYELIFSLLMLAPVIGLALVSSAFAKKTPFYLFMVPFLLVGADKVMGATFGITLGLSKLTKMYGDALELTQDAFMLQHPLHFTSAMILPLLTCIAVGAALIAGAVWLRNNRYEI